MSKKIPSGITKEFLESVPLPKHGGRYTAISHKSIIDKVVEKLGVYGLSINSELYRCTISGNVANGMYILNQEKVPGLKMAFIWGNSYDKSMRFKSGIGVYLPETDSMIFAGVVSNYSRKHTGTADKEAEEAINSQIMYAEKYYDFICDMRQKLMAIEISKEDIANIVGRLFILEEALNKEQTGLLADYIKQEKPLFEDVPFYNAWTFYMYISIVMKMSHPKMWFESHSIAHDTFMNYFAVGHTVDLPEDATSIPPTTDSEVPSNQISIFDVIEEEEKKNDDLVDFAPEDISAETEEHLAIENILEDKTRSGETNPDEFFKLGDSDSTFELPEL